MTPASPERSHTSQTDRFDFIAAVTVLARKGMVLLGAVTLGATAGIAYHLIAGPAFAATSKFAPESTSAGSLSRLTGLAATVGLAVPSFSGSESIWFYADLLASGDVLEQLSRTRFSFRADDSPDAPLVTGTLIELLDIADDTEEATTRAAIEEVGKRVSTHVDQDANIVTLTTVAPWEALADSMNARLLELLQEFNIQRRQNRAAIELEFLDTRVQAVAQDLESAELALQAFLERNRTFAGSPQLEAAAARLQRRVNLHQQLYVSLLQAQQQARMEEARGTPVVTVVAHPGNTTRDVASGLRRVALGGLLTLALAVVWTLLDDFWRRYDATYPVHTRQLRDAIARAFGPRSHRADSA